MKFKYVLVTLVAFAGFGASFALADGGHGENGPGNGNCKHGAVLGTLSAPQSFTVTIVKANGQSGFSAGQTVTVDVGGSGSQVRLAAEGCIGTDGALTVHEAELHARNPNAANHEDGDHNGQSTNEQTSSTGTTTSAHD
jgi:hypothetical protein